MAKHTKLADTHPELLLEWHKSKNASLDPLQLSTYSHKEVWWRCKTRKRGHVWKTQVRGRTHDRLGCPFCSNRAVCRSNSLGVTHPHLIEEWHVTRNGSKTIYDYTYGSGARVWWKCKTRKRGHVWQSMIKHRANGSGCPFCAGRRKLEHEK